MIKHPQAQYIDAEIPDYEGHPLINALPPINSPQQTAQQLNRYPKVGESEKKLPGHIRRHAMMRILDQFLYPTKAHLQLEQMLSSMIRRGYLSRNIADASYQRNLDTVGYTDFKTASRNAGNESLVSSVIGCSGTGKSTAVEAILNCYPQVIYHPDFQHTQLVWLKVECPHDGSVRHLCINFFRAVDDALGTDYQQLFVKTRSSAESMLGDVARVVALHSVGLLVIDEIQHLEKSKSGGSQKMLNFFVTLTNVIKVPVLFIGTPKALDLFSPTMRSARRAAQFGSLNWNRFERSEKPEQDAEWERFIKRLWKLQWFENPTPLTEPMKEQFWEFTQGIPHVAVSLFYLCQTRAVMAGREVIDQLLVEKVFNEELSLIHPMIKALKSGRKEKILAFADLDIPTETIRASGSYLSEPESLQVTPEAQQPSKTQQLIGMLVQMGIGSDIAPAVAEQAIEEKPDEDLFGLVAHIRFLQEKRIPKPTSKKESPTPLKPRYLENDLRLIRHDSANEAYRQLKKMGVVIQLDNFL
ncbi:ATP-binding protein [Oceanospirillum sp. HFRX-1_2]